MSVELLKDSESLGRCATNVGFSEMADYAIENGGDTCADFFGGSTDDPAAFVKELQELLDGDVPDDVESTIQCVIEMLDGVKSGTISATSELVLG